MVFLDNANGLVNSSTTYDPETRTCGEGRCAVYTDLEQAAQALSVGDTLYVREGTYSRPSTGEYHTDRRGSGGRRYSHGALSIRAPASGTPESHTVVSAHKDELVIIQAKPVMGRLSDHFGRR